MSEKCITATVSIRVPSAGLRAAIMGLADDPALARAYFQIRGTTSPSRIVESEAARLVIYEPAYEPATRGHGMLGTGWTITYALRETSAETCEVDVSVSYNWLTAVSGFGLIKPQAENELLQRVAILFAYERGYDVRSGSRTSSMTSREAPTPA